MMGSLHVWLKLSPLLLQLKIIRDDLCVTSPPSFGFGFSLFVPLVGFLAGHKCGTFHGFF
jgi:hypothetical protein